MANYKVGDRILLRAQFNGATAPVNTGAVPTRWDCPTGQAVPDNGGVSTNGTMVFTLTQAGQGVNLRVQRLDAPLLHAGVAIDIDPLPPITGTSVVIEGLAP